MRLEQAAGTSDTTAALLEAAHPVDRGPARTKAAPGTGPAMDCCKATHAVERSPPGTGEVAGLLDGSLAWQVVPHYPPGEGLGKAASC